MGSFLSLELAKDSSFTLFWIMVSQAFPVNAQRIMNLRMSSGK